ncbi:MAG: acylphosphatase [Gammaproteobacteria bacterium]|nr:acylphosphatase [Gammaproteobacteria bacterium]
MAAGMHCLVSGRVQGVSFRAATRTLACSLGLVGWVRNLPDGRVEVRADGPPDALRRLRRWLHTGPPGARVHAVECVPATDAVTCADFRVC